MLEVFTNPDADLHQVPAGYPEQPSRRTVVVDHLRSREIEVREVASSETAREIVERLHDADYLGRFERAVARGDGLLDSADNPLSKGTWRAAWGAVEASIAAADWVMEGPSRCAFAAVRPPGHHAERATAMGFCYLNNAAVVAEHLLFRHDLERVAIFDFDVHHGNGTQHLFEERGDVLYVSTHQWPFYPGTGAASETGSGTGAGTTLNLPLAAGADDQVYAEALTQGVLPALSRFRPRALVLSAGFDAWRNDPLGGMRVSREGFADWGRRLGAWAAERTEGRVVALLEGGYDLEALPDLVAAHLEGLEEGLGSGSALS